MSSGWLAAHGLAGVNYKAIMLPIMVLWFGFYKGRVPAWSWEHAANDVSSKAWGVINLYL